MSDPKKKLSPVEGIKAESDYLRGEIAEELVDGNDFFGKTSIQLLKHHGMYQQDDRDIRGAKNEDGTKVGKSYSMMVRIKIPGGRLTSEQMLAEIDMCDEMSDKTLRITTRQGVQFHGVLKKNVRELIQRINAVQLSTLAACGDVERNVMCCPAPYCADPIHREMQELADRFAEHFCPRTTAYHEVWLTDDATGEKQLVGGGSQGHEVEPIYGPTYLPRKFKTAIGLPGDNCVDLYTHDLGLLAICEDHKIIGYNLLVGGGFGMTPSAKKTFPALGKRLTFVTPDQVLEVATAIVKVQRDFGNRADRKIARLKYLIADWGIEKFKAKVEEYYGDSLPEPHPEDVWGFHDHIGWHEQGDGKWFYGLNVENGRVLDQGDFKLKSALRAICTTLKPGIRLTAHQSILMTDIRAEDRDRLEQILRDHGVKRSEEISTVRRWSMACVALPTCPLSITESERALPAMIDEIEVELAKLGLSNEAFTIRMTGCPNGCARPYNSDIGLVGKSAGKYTVYVGGRLIGNRMNFIYQDSVPAEDVVATLTPLFVYFKSDRNEDESLGDFCHRIGVDALRAFGEQYVA